MQHNPLADVLLPPPPQKIFEYLNGHLIGHYVMKKALSVAAYNHFCDVSMKRNLARMADHAEDEGVATADEEEDDEDDEEAPPTPQQQRKQSRVGFLNKPTVHRYMNLDCCEEQEPENEREKKTKGSNDSGFSCADTDSPVTTGRMLTPIVARVIIEASTHKVHLRKSNALTFDSTGSSRPLDAIASNLAKFLDVPFVKTDCRYLIGQKKAAARRAEEKLEELNNGDKNGMGGRKASFFFNAAAAATETAAAKADGESSSVPEQDPKSRMMAKTTSLLDPEVRRPSLQLGPWRHLLRVKVGNTVQQEVQKLFKQSGYDAERAERGILFLDCLDACGSSAIDYGDDPEEAAGEVLAEVLELIEGKRIEVTRPKDASNDEDGEDEERLTLSTEHMFFICFGVKDDLEKDKDGGGDKDAAKAGASRKDSGNGGSHNARAIRGHQHGDASDVYRAARTFDRVSSSSSSSACSSASRFTGSEYSYEDDDYDEDEDEDGSYYDYPDSDGDDDSYQGLKENRLAAKLLLEEDRITKQCQDLWGMRDVELKLEKEALEVIANQATQQNAGASGVRTILEKLLLAVKFELPNLFSGKQASSSTAVDDGKPVSTVEITEDFVLGKAPPIIHHHGKNTKDFNRARTRKRSGVRPLNPIDEEGTNSIDKGGGGPVLLTEFEEQLMEELGLSL